MTTLYSLSQLGWQPFFQQQLSLDEWQDCRLARVADCHRASFELLTEQGPETLSITPGLPALTTGDWLLLDSQHRVVRRLERSSQFSRKAPGTKVAEQLIAANVDTLLIVSSLNQDFNLSRFERYLALAREAGVEPVVVLTKRDCCDTPEDYLNQLQTLDPLLMVVAVNALDNESVRSLAPWCRPGKSLALLGSSGVGKSTLVNTLMGNPAQQTGTIREDDAKGRHTTTSRSLHLLPGGALLLDTPGMRQLQLADCEQGIESTFGDISELANRCQFADCQHQREPGCAVQAAIADGALSERRLGNYRKLMLEQARNGESLAQKRARERGFSKMCRNVLNHVRQRKKG